MWAVPTTMSRTTSTTPTRRPDTPWWLWVAAILCGATLDRQLAWAIFKKVLPPNLHINTITAIAAVGATVLAADYTLSKIVQNRVGWERKGWRHLFAGISIYGGFSYLRNSVGSATNNTQTAFRNGDAIVRTERKLGLFIEQPLQHLWLSAPGRGGMFLFGVYYATAHFAVTIGVLLHLWRKHPERFARYGTLMACAAGVALISFWKLPVMPPRLLSTVDPTYKIVDALAETGGSVQTAETISVSNQYAAMPSLHCAWAMWCALATWHNPRLRKWMTAHACITILCVLVTGHHYWLDVVGGGMALCIGWIATEIIRRTTTRLKTLRQQRSATKNDGTSAASDTTTLDQHA